MSLFAAELLRLFSRRVTLVVTMLIAGLLAFLTFGFSLSSSRPTDAEEAEAARRATVAAELWDAEVRNCLDVQSGLAEPSPGQNLPPGCDYGPRPTADAMLDYGFSFRRQWPELFYTAAIVLTMAGFVIGSSFVGAEWSSGGMVNLLLWRPRRAAVLGAKLAAALAGMLALSVAYLVLWSGAFLAVAATSGVVGQLTAAEMSSLLLTGVRVVALALAGTAFGFAIASIGQRTATAAGVGIAYLLLYELGGIMIFGLAGTDYSERFRLSTYVIAWLTTEYTFSDTNYTCDALGCVSVPAWTAGWVHGGLVLGAVLALIVGAAFLSMRRRDIA